MLNFKKKKYKFTNETLCVGDTVLHRIVSLRNFNDVKKGQLGGFIETEKNLSHDGDCWVYYHAKVKDHARVMNNAEIKGDAYIFENAEVSGNAIITDKAYVYGSALVNGNTIIKNDAQVYGDATISGNAIICGLAIVRDDSHVYERAVVGEHAVIEENASIGGKSIIYGSSIIKGDVVIENFETYRNASISKTNDYFSCDMINYEIGPTSFYKTETNKIRVVYHIDNGSIATDMSIDSFMKMINEKCMNTDNINSYIKLIELVESIIKVDEVNMYE